jgi:hypothetical protein
MKTEPGIKRDRQFDKAFVLPTVIFIIFYAPYLFEKTAFINTHDNLDSEVVWNAIIGKYLAGELTTGLFLNGNLPLWVLPRITQPIILFYAVLSPLKAYLATDITVRIVAYFGCYKMCCALGADRLVSIVLATLFAFSITYSVYGFTVAGLPYCVYCLVTEGNLSLRMTLVALIGWSSSLYLSGCFFLAAAPVLLIFVLRRHVTLQAILIMVAYSVGLILGSIGLIWAQFFSGIVWHRSEWRGLPEVYFQGSGRDPWYYVFIDSYNPFYHVGPLMLVLFTCCLIVFFYYRSVNLGRGLGLICIIGLIYFLNHSWFMGEVKDRIGGLFRTFQFDRFYFLGTTIIMVCAALASQASKYARNGIIIGALLELCLTVAYIPQWRQTLKSVLSKPSMPTFSQYYMTDWYRSSGLGAETPVLSIGAEPMAAPMNGIPSIDGYFNLYPVAYKHAFLKVIRNSLEESGRAEYFKYWGSRVYAFAPEAQPELIDYCAAHELGARFVVSKSKIASSQVLQVNGSGVGPYLYKIDGCGNSPGANGS